MNALRAKVIFFAVLIAGFVPIYIRAAGGDRRFTVGLWLVFSCIVGTFVLLMPVLRCPNCGCATQFFDYYPEATYRLTGGFRRRVKCAHCHSFIDRLTSAVVTQLSQEEGRKLDRLSFLARMWLWFLAAGSSLVLASTGAGFILSLIALEGRANNQRFGVAVLGCVGVFTLGLLLIATGWHQKRRAKRFAEQQHIKFPNKVHIRV